MKSYTDFEQSKKLAKILSSESADMCYGIDDDTLTFDELPWLTPYYEYTYKEHYVPCWSLAALLSVLPSHFYDKTGRKTFGMDKGDIYFNIFYENKNSYIQKSADNPIDACYEMIIKLKELKLL